MANFTDQVNSATSFTDEGSTLTIDRSAYDDSNVNVFMFNELCLNDVVPISDYEFDVGELAINTQFTNYLNS